MTLKRWFDQSLPVSLMSLMMGGGAIVGAIISIENPAFAQSVIVPDNTLGNESSNVIENFNGLPVDVIVNGAQRGQNLFHSFRGFNVSEGRGAYFFSPDAGIQNILARVTGTNPSQIFGTLGTFGNSQPNLFLINPNGIIFGRNASLDVGRSFYGTTASGLKFGDVGEFSAVNPQPPTNLLTINPSAFFFTARPPGAIVNQSQATETILGTPALGLSVQSGQTLLLLGGPVAIEDGRIIAVDGRVEIGAVAGVGTVELVPEGRLRLTDNVQRADVLISNSQILSLPLESSGGLTVTARNIVIQQSATAIGITTERSASARPVGDVSLNATGAIQIGQSSQVSNIASEGVTGNTGKIEIVADSLQITGASNLSTNRFQGASGNTGKIEITTGSLQVEQDSALSTNNLGVGDTGSITINAREGVVLDRGFVAAITTNSVSNASDLDNGIRLTARSLTLANGSQLSTFLLSRGKSGDINIDVPEAVIISGTNSLFGVSSGSGIVTGIATGAVGRSGTISLNAGSLSIQEQGGLFSGTLGQGDGGNIFIQIQNTVVLNRGVIGSSVLPGGIGKAGDIEIQARSLTLLNGGQISAGLFSGDNLLAGGQGQGGNIRIRATDFVSLSGFNPAPLSTENLVTGTEIAQVQGASSGLLVLAERSTVGSAGSITVDTHRFQVADGAIVSAFTANSNPAGDITINADSFAAIGGGQLLTTTFSSGQAGNIQLNITDQTILSGKDYNFANRLNQFSNSTVANQGANSGIFANTTLDSSGKGGNITLNTRALQVSEGGLVDARTAGLGNSGNVTINTVTVDVLDGGQLLAITEGSGRAGSIAVNASEQLTISGTDPTYTTRLAQSGFVSPVSANSGIYVRSQSTGGAGDITVKAPQIWMDQGVISAESAAVDGGNINLNVGQLLLLRNGSLISASAGTAQQGGNGGNITINAPNGFIIGVKSENSDITANAFTGSGGRVNITAQGILGLEFRPQLTEFSDITASSAFGASGIVTLNTPNIDPSRGLVELPQNLVDTNRILANSCIVRDSRTGNTFLITGNGGLPIRPGDPPLPVFPTGDVRGVEKAEGEEQTVIRHSSFVPGTGQRTKDEGQEGIQNPESKIQNENATAIVEAQGIYRLPDGQLILSWECGQQQR